MHTLVTGATGFIGSHLVERLAARGDALRALVRSTSNLSVLPKIDLFVGDLTQAETVERAMVGVECVYHCAGVVTDWDPDGRSWAVNVMGVTALAEAALRAGVKKFVHVSTTDVYGYPDRRTTEDVPYRYRGWPYCNTKIDAEKRVWEYHQKGLPVTVLRPATVYGPRSYSIVGEFVDLLRSGEMVLIDGGRKLAGLCYVSDLVDALLLAGQEGAGVGRAYNITDGAQTTWAEFTHGLARVMGLPRARLSIPYGVAYSAGWLMERWGAWSKSSRRPLLTRMAVELVGTHQDFPNDRARAELGFEPQVFLEEGLQRSKAWLDQE
ncbi:MAG: NAD-dependent epimerase/dehydratase family protein [Anaerolineales bacterium]|nr:NAD-dependent epimerase/dehydratase family protein [Anaerolineales bacterium]